MTIATQQGNTYQFFQPLSPQEREALKQDIEKRGIQVSIEIDGDGRILDGHHRWEIAQELGWTKERIPTVVRAELMTEADKITHVLKVNLLRRKSVSLLTQAKCVLALKDARGIDTTINHNGNTPRADTLSALWKELGLNERSGRRYLQWYEELKDHPELYEQVESGKKTVAQARKEAGTFVPKPRKKKSLLQGKDPKGAMGFLEEVQDFAYKHIQNYEESEMLSHTYDREENKILLVIAIKI